MPTFSPIFKLVLVGLFLVAIAELVHAPVAVVNFLAGLAYPETITPQDLQTRYDQEKIKILLVPGHDLEYSGAVFGNLREADLNLLLASDLATMLIKDSRFEVITTRDFGDGEYNITLGNFFSERRAEIETFRDQLKVQFTNLMESGELVAQRGGVHHNFARPEVGFRLYGINLWANENNVDVALHIHFNDYPERRPNRPGRYSGLTVYVPEGQYPNARASAALGQSLFNQLTKYFAPSDLPAESTGVVEDQDLIAIGARGSREGASLLIEYGYIYEPQFVNEEVRPAMLAELAWQTYQGIKKHFEPTYTEAPSLLLVGGLTEHLQDGARGRRDVLVLQKILQTAGLYPPAGKTLNNCPLNGNFGSCTATAVKNFQAKHNLPPTGFVGDLTLQKLNERYAG